MLLTTIGCLADQSVAERMREVALRLHCNYALAEQAADEALGAYQTGLSEEAAIRVGIDFIQGVRREREPSDNPPTDPSGRVPFGWVDSWPFIILMILAACGMAYLESQGLLS